MLRHLVQATARPLGLWAGDGTYGAVDELLAPHHVNAMVSDANLVSFKVVAMEMPKAIQESGGKIVEDDPMMTPDLHDKAGRSDDLAGRSPARYGQARRPPAGLVP
jgi:hypothetical protein